MGTEANHLQHLTGLRADATGLEGREQRHSVSAIGYVSGSSHAPGSGDRSAEADLRNQAGEIERYCIARGWRLRKLVWETNQDGARAAGQPALEYAVRWLESEREGCLVVSRLETLSHSMAGLGGVLTELERKGAHLVCLDPEIDTQSEAGATVLRALIAVSHRERQRLGARTRKGLVTARSKRAVSRPAVEDRPELRERILAMRASGMTLQAIADQLNEDGVPTLRGGTHWRPSSVHATTGYKRRENGPNAWRAPRAQS